MRTVSLRTALLAAAVAAIGAAGCGKPHATIRYATGGPDEQVRYDSATFQLARQRKVQIILFRRTAAPIGEADPDFEYLFFQLPERARYGWLRDDGVPAYRWVRQGGQDRVWLGTAGQVRLRMRDSKQRMHFDFRATMEPVAGTPGGAYVLAGNPKVVEDTVKTQSLINRYGEWLASIVNPKPTDDEKK